MHLKETKNDFKLNFIHLHTILYIAKQKKLPLSMNCQLTEMWELSLFNTRKKWYFSRIFLPKYWTNFIGLNTYICRYILESKSSLYGSADINLDDQDLLNTTFIDGPDQVIVYDWNTYRITQFLKVETDTNTSIAESLIIYVNTFKTKVIVFISNIIACLTSHVLIIFNNIIRSLILTIILKVKM